VYVPSKEEAWQIIENQRQHQYPSKPKSKFVANTNNWKHLEKYGSNIWTYVFPDEVPGQGNMKVLGLHYCKGKSPFMFVFDEVIGVDHWWGGRQRGGHDHKRGFKILYFDDNKGFLAGENIDSVPHYGIIKGSQIQDLDLEDEIKSAMEHHPRKVVSSCLYRDYPVKINAQQDAKDLFEASNNPTLIQPVKEEVLERLRGISVHVKGDYEPTFSLRDPQNKQEVLFKLMELCNPEVSYR
jgi:hypothetical protein